VIETKIPHEMDTPPLIQFNLVKQEKLRLPLIQEAIEERSKNTINILCKDPDKPNLNLSPSADF
jgi:hypothetical protein